MPTDTPRSDLALQKSLRDLIALSAVPSLWVGREPQAIAADLVDLLAGLLNLDFAFVRLGDSDSDTVVEIERGTAPPALLERLRHYREGQGRLSQPEIIPGDSVRGGGGIVLPLGLDVAGVVAAASARAHFPSSNDQLLLSVAAGHGATAFGMARLVEQHRRAETALAASERQLRQARDELETKVAERTAELRRSEAYRMDAERQLESELAHLNRLSMMGVMAASLAHEVKQPMAAARNNARAALNFLARKPPDLGEVKEALGCIVNDADRAGDIIDRIRAQVKKAPPRSDRFDVNEAVTEVVGLARHAISKTGVSLQIRLARGPFTIWGDRVQLQQVILNLVLNAVEAMSSLEDGPRELLISTERRQGQAVVCVYDSGPGVAPEQSQHVFEAFYTTKSNGIGIGLSICRSIIDAHGGLLWVEANSPRGAVFRFSVPSVANQLKDSPASIHRAREPRAGSARDVAHRAASAGSPPPHPAAPRSRRPRRDGTS